MLPLSSCPFGQCVGSTSTSRGRSVSVGDRRHSNACSTFSEHTTCRSRSGADAFYGTDDVLTDELGRFREAVDRWHRLVFHVVDPYVGGAAGLRFASAGQGEAEFRVGVVYLTDGYGVAGECNPRMSEDHVTDFFGAGEQRSVLVDVRQVVDDQERMVKPFWDVVRPYGFNELQRVIADTALYAQRRGRSGLVAWWRLKNWKVGLGLHRVVACFADEDSGEVVKRTSQVVGRVTDGERYGHFNRLEADSGQVHGVSIEIECKFAGDRWWAAVEVIPDALAEIVYVLVGPVEFVVDVAELLAHAHKLAPRAARPARPPREERAPGEAVSSLQSAIGLRRGRGLS